MTTSQIFIFKTSVASVAAWAPWWESLELRLAQVILLIYIILTALQVNLPKTIAILRGVYFRV